jgi:hypothetical protein
MKTEKEINEVLDRLPTIGETAYSGMTYEQGIEEVLLWVLGEISEGDFSYST